MTLNFFSALLGTLGVCLLAANLWISSNGFALFQKNNIGRIPRLTACLVGAFSFAFSKSYWSASLAAKGSIYVLQIVLELSLLLCLQEWAQIKEPRKYFSISKLLLLTIFVFSLGFINHWPTQMLLIPGLGLLAYAHLDNGGAKAFQVPRWKKILICLALSLVVASLYLYLPLRSCLYPLLNFGAPFTFYRFIGSILRADYSKVETLASFMPTALSTIQKKAIYISNHFLGEFNLGFLLLSVVGVWGFLKQGRKPDLLFLLLILLTTLVANLLYLQVLPIEYWHLDDHLLTMNWVTALLSSIGISFLFTFFLEQFSRWRNQTMPVVLGTFLLCFFPISSLLDNLSANDQRTEFLFHSYGIGLMKSMGKNALYFAESDYDYFSLLYLTAVERKRNDVCLLLVPFLSKDYQYALLQRDQHLKALPSANLSGQAVFFHTLANLPASTPLYCAFPNGPFAKMYLRHNLFMSFQPEGLTVRIHPPHENRSSGNAINLLDEFWVRHLIFPNRSKNPINGLFLELCAHPYLNMAQYLLLHNDSTNWDLLDRRALELIHEDPWLAEEWSGRGDGNLHFGKKSAAAGDYENAGTEYEIAGFSEKSLKCLQKALALDPKNDNARRSWVALLSAPK